MAQKANGKRFGGQSFLFTPGVEGQSGDRRFGKAHQPELVAPPRTACTA